MSPTQGLETIRSQSKTRKRAAKTKRPKNDVVLFDNTKPRSKSQQRRMETPRPKLVAVKQDPKVDWTKMPVDDNHVIMQITGGEALMICKDAVKERKEFMERRMKLIRQLKKLARFSKEMRAAAGITYFSMDDIYSTGFTAQISFTEKAEKRSARKATLLDNHTKLRKALEKDGRFRIMADGFMHSGGRGQYWVKLAINRKNNAPEAAKEMARIARQIVEKPPGSGTIASRILNPPERDKGNFIAGGERFVAMGGRTALISAGVFQRAGRWFLAYPCDPKKPPAKLEFPKGTLKRLKLSQYWRMMEQAALDG